MNMWEAAEEALARRQSVPSTRSGVRAQRATFDWLQSLEGRQMILEKTRNGEELVDFLVAVLRGARFRWPELHPKELPGLPIRPTAQQRVLAATWLAERVWGLAPRLQEPPAQPELAQEAAALELTAAEAQFLEAARSLAIERGEAGADAGELDRSVTPSVTPSVTSGGDVDPTP
jgi:hypothetical protein